MKRSAASRGCFWLCIAGAALVVGCSYRPLPRLVDRDGTGGKTGGGAGGSGVGGSGTGGRGTGGRGTGGNSADGSGVGGNGIGGAGGCDATGICRSPRGQRCSGTDRLCVTGSFCSPDGICCDQPCAQSCLACDVPAHFGTCTPVTSGPPHTNHAPCKDQQPTCAGTCAGSADGTCVHLAHTCGLPSCSGALFVGDGLCDTAGDCVRPTPSVCVGGYVCSVNACLTACDSDADCRTGYFCAAGICRVGATAIAAGSGHTCALLGDGGVRCWGSNRHGQLGDGTTIDSPSPVAVTGLNRRAAALAAGGGHTCALLVDGTVQCWGENGSGALGDGTMTDSPAQVTVSGLAGDPTSITAGAGHTCAVLAGGAVGCWGSNHLCSSTLDGSSGCRPDTTGQLGDGTTVDSAVVVPVIGLAGAATAIAAGASHTCALFGDGAVQCWGDNFYGDLGNGGGAGSAIPVDVIGLPAAVTAIAAGPQRTCAVLDDSSLDCWGYFFITPRPVPVTGLQGVAAVSAGLYHICVLLDDGQVRCEGGNGNESGTNTFGQLGNGTTTDWPGPVLVKGLEGTPAVTALTSGLYHSCALLADGGVRCWGDNGQGQLGSSVASASSVPLNVDPW